jgi:sulfite reductase (NADPH) flavoprotein alpha-component
MLAAERLKQLQELVSISTKEELIWINGYLSGLVSNGHTETPAIALEHEKNNSQSPLHAVQKISLVYGTETGNSKNLSTRLAAIARKKGVHMKVTGLDQYHHEDLAREEILLVVISTQGEGEPPVGAKKFYDHIHQHTLSVPSMKYSVLALGDSSYPLFCQTGVDVDARLHGFGAKRLVPLQKCDVDYEADAEEWLGQVLDKIALQPAIVPVKTIAEPARKPQGRKFYNGQILTNINLNDRGSNKQTFHIEIKSAEPVEYEPGDALAIIPSNKKIIVDHIISLTGVDKNHVIETAKARGTIEELLTNHLNICFLLSSVIKKFGAITGQELPDVRMDLVDLLRIYPISSSAQFLEILKILSPIAPRLYSISSSPLAHGPNDMHLTVSRHSFRVKEEQRFGLCSDFLGELPIGTQVSFYIHKNKSFRLPAHDRDIIMIGPGTGVAPFRSFLAERDAAGATGKNWFFFGEQHFISDFLYQAEMQQLHQMGVLTRISLAFSRDQDQKLYVQHRMLEQSAELYKWIRDGAFIYISGTKDPMSKDVEHTLLQIFREQGNLGDEEAKKYLHHLKESGRYEKDVY